MSTNGIDETIRLWSADPNKAKGNPIVRARAERPNVVLETGSFTWRSDLPASLGGKNEAPSPTVMLLGALAGCAVLLMKDTLAPQLGIRVNSIEATAQCKADARGLLGMPGATPELHDFELKFEIDTPDGPEKADELYRVWQERCPVFLALTKPLPVKTSLSVKG